MWVLILELTLAYRNFILNYETNEAFLPKKSIRFGIAIGSTIPHIQYEI